MADNQKCSKERQDFIKMLEGLFTSLPGSTEVSAIAESKNEVAEVNKIVERVFLHDLKTGKKKIMKLSPSIASALHIPSDRVLNCDYASFKWIIRWLSVQNQPALEFCNVLEILETALLLKISVLSEACVVYWRKNLNSVPEPSNDWLTNNSEAVRLLVKLFSNLEIEDLYFHHRLLGEHLYEYYIDKIEKNSSSTLLRCIHCKRIVDGTQTDIRCTNILLTVKGNLEYRHEAVNEWCLHDEILNLYRSLSSWRAVYWDIWASIHFLHCSLCQTTFPAKEMSRCLYHPEEPVTSQPPSRYQIYKCCQERIPKFSPVTLESGCKGRMHAITPENQTEDSVLKTYNKMKYLIDKKENFTESSESQPSFKESFVREIAKNTIISSKASKFCNLEDRKCKKTKRYRHAAMTAMGRFQDEQRDFEVKKFDIIEKLLSTQEMERSHLESTGGSYVSVERNFWENYHEKLMK